MSAPGQENRSGNGFASKIETYCVDSGYCRGHTFAKAAESHLQSLIIILLDNAIKYSQKKHILPYW